MMMMPSLFGENLFDELMNDRFMDNFRTSFFGKRENNLMKTDIQEKDGFYHLDMDLPGFNKEDIQVDLKDGYLTITAAKNEEKNEKDDAGSYIRQERYTGQSSRRFYVGRDMNVESMKAGFQNGILHLVFPKQDQKQVEEQHRILIE